MKAGDVIENIATGVRTVILVEVQESLFIYDLAYAHCLCIPRDTASRDYKLVGKAEDHPKEKHYDLKVKIQPGNCGYILENNAVVKVDIARVFVAITTKGIEVSYGTADEYSYYANRIFATKEELLASL